MKASVDPFRVQRFVMFPAKPDHFIWPLIIGVVRLRLFGTANLTGVTLDHTMAQRSADRQVRDVRLGIALAPPLLPIEGIWLVSHADTAADRSHSGSTLFDRRSQTNKRLAARSHCGLYCSGSFAASLSALTPDAVAAAPGFIFSKVIMRPALPARFPTLPDRPDASNSDD